MSIEQRLADALRPAEGYLQSKADHGDELAGKLAEAARTALCGVPRNLNPNRKPPVVLCCRNCGSTNIRADAYAIWNVQTQEFELDAVYDSKVCEDCQYESNHCDERPATEAELAGDDDAAAAMANDQPSVAIPA